MKTAESCESLQHDATVATWHCYAPQHTTKHTQWNSGTFRSVWTCLFQDIDCFFLSFRSFPSFFLWWWITRLIVGLSVRARTQYVVVLLCFIQLILAEESLPWRSRGFPRVWRPRSTYPRMDRQGRMSCHFCRLQEFGVCVALFYWPEGEED